mgnify:FL=1
MSIFKKYNIEETDIKKSKLNKYLLTIVILVVSLQIFYFLKRIVFPDLSYDTLNYHFFSGKSGFDNFPYFFKSSEFYPLGMHSFNPFIDMFNYMTYLIFGYRLGTILSLFSAVGITILSYLIIQKLISEKNKILLFFFLVPIFVVNEELFQIGTYYTDNMYSFLLVLYLFLLLKFVDNNRKLNIFILSIIGLIFGIVVTKLTNVIYAVPFYVATIYLIFLKNNIYKKVNFKKFIIETIFYTGIVIAVNFFLFINILESKNPVFPYYNKIFKSVYYPENSWNFNFGPITVKQRVFYPYYAFKDPTILGEVKDIFPDNKLLILFIFSLVFFVICLIYKKKFKAEEKLIIFIYFLSYLIWQFQFGYARYGIFLEILGGIVSFIFMKEIFEKKSFFLKIFSIIFIVVLFFQSYKIINFNYKYYISWWKTPSVYEWKKMFFSKTIFEKYTEIDKETKDDLSDVSFIIQCKNPSSAYFSTVETISNLPMLNFDGVNKTLTENIEYQKRRDVFLNKDKNAENLKFAMIFGERNGELKKEKEECLDNLKGYDIDIIKEEQIDNFIADGNKKMILLIGRFNLSN